MLITIGVAYGSGSRTLVHSDHNLIICWPRHFLFDIFYSSYFIQCVGFHTGREAEVQHCQLQVVILKLTITGTFLMLTFYTDDIPKIILIHLVSFMGYFQ
jgi:hypothetical protein